MALFSPRCCLASQLAPVTLHAPAKITPLFPPRCPRRPARPAPPRAAPRRRKGPPLARFGPVPRPGPRRRPFARRAARRPRRAARPARACPPKPPSPEKGPPAAAAPAAPCARRKRFSALPCERLCPPRGDQIPKIGSEETAAPSRVNFRRIPWWGYSAQKAKKQPSAGRLSFYQEVVREHANESAKNRGGSAQARKI